MLFGFEKCCRCGSWTGNKISKSWHFAPWMRLQERLCGHSYVSTGGREVMTVATRKQFADSVLRWLSGYVKVDEQTTMYGCRRVTPISFPLRFLR